MARFTREPGKNDMLAKPLATLLNNDWLVAPGMPSVNSAILANPDVGIVIVLILDSYTIPSVSEDGGIQDVDHALLIRQAKEAMGKAAASVPIAFLAWFPLLDDSTPTPLGMDAITMHCGASDLNALREAVEICVEQNSAPIGWTFAALEKSLRSGVVQTPRAIPLDQVGTHAPLGVTVSPGKPMDKDDPMILLVGEGIRREVRETKVHYAGMSVSLPDLAGPCNLLPALLVVAAESWGAADMSLQGRGGFHVHLVSMNEEQSAWTGFAVGALQASAMILLTLCINATLRSCRQSDGTICLDSLILRFVRFMEINGHANMDLQAIKSSIEADDNY